MSNVIIITRLTPDNICRDNKCQIIFQKIPVSGKRVAWEVWFEEVWFWVYFGSMICLMPQAWHCKRFVYDSWVWFGAWFWIWFDEMQHARGHKLCTRHFRLNTLGPQQCASQWTCWDFLSAQCVCHVRGIKMFFFCSSLPPRVQLFQTDLCLHTSHLWILWRPTHCNSSTAFESEEAAAAAAGDDAMHPVRPSQNMII